MEDVTVNWYLHHCFKNKRYSTKFISFYNTIDRAAQMSSVLWDFCMSKHSQNRSSMEWC